MDASGIEPEPQPCHGRIMPLEHAPLRFLGGNVLKILSS